MTTLFHDHNPQSIVELSCNDSILTQLLEGEALRTASIDRIRESLGTIDSLVVDVLALQSSSKETLKEALLHYDALKKEFVKYQQEVPVPHTAAEKTEYITSFLKRDERSTFHRGFKTLAEGIASNIEGTGELGDCYNVTFTVFALAPLVDLEMLLHRDLYHIFASVSDDGFSWTPIDFAYGDNILDTAYEADYSEMKHTDTGRPADTLTYDNITALFLCRHAMDSGLPQSQSLEYYNEALRKYPEWAELYNDIGDIHFFNGDVTGAMAYYETSIEKENFNIFFRLNHVVCELLLHETDDISTQIAEVDALLELYSGFTEGRFVKALLEHDTENIAALWPKVLKGNHLMYGQFMLPKMYCLLATLGYTEDSEPAQVPKSALLSLTGSALQEQVLENDLYQTASLKTNFERPNEYLHVHSIESDVLTLVDHHLSTQGLSPFDTNVLVWGYGATVILPRILIDTGYKVSGVEYGGQHELDEDGSLYLQIEKLFARKGVEHEFPELSDFQRFPHYDTSGKTFDVTFIVNPNPSLWANDPEAGVREWSRWMAPGSIAFLQIDGDYKDPTAIAHVLYHQIETQSDLEIIHETVYPGTRAPLPSLYKNYTARGNALLLVKKHVADPSLDFEE